jgi:hypothetical protein
MSRSVIKWRAKGALKGLEYCYGNARSMLTKDMWEKKPRTLSCVRGVAAHLTSALCIFASHENDSRLRPSVFAYVEALASAGFDIVFVSTSPSIESADMQRLRESCTYIVSRENRGYDFYSWKTGMSEYPDYQRHAGLLLANDSVFGPLFDIGNLIERLESTGADVVGMTDSLIQTYHLQSYFLYFKRSVVLSQRFTDFFCAIQARSYKETIIRKYEIGISRRIGHEFSLSALYKVDNVLSHVSFDARPPNWTNLTVHLWKELILDFHFPFLKKSIVKSGSASEAEVARMLAATGSTYDPVLLRI